MRPDVTSVVSANQARMKSCHDRHAKFREFETGQLVLARDYRSKEKWQSGIIVKKRSPLSYTVSSPDGRIWNRHIDQLLKDSPEKFEYAEATSGKLGDNANLQD